jgi:hypothetical protein
MYKIVRTYFNGTKRTIDTGLSLAEVRAHCKDPESSSRTCTRADRKRITKRMGHWFDGYDVCRK